jgi:hypothetical protein
MSVLARDVSKRLARARGGSTTKSVDRWLRDLQNSINLGDVASTFANGDATPSVLDNSKFITAGSTTITNFDDGVDGQTITVYWGGTNITIADNATIDTLGGGNIMLNALVPQASFRLTSGVWKQTDIGRFYKRHAEDYGAVGDGTTDDTTAIQALLTAGYIWEPLSNKSYFISQRLNITVAGTGIWGDGSATLIMSTVGFNNTTSGSGTRYGTTAVGVYASAIDRPVCRGVRIKYQAQTDDRYVKAVAFRSCTNVTIEYTEAWNFTKALGVLYLGACANGSVSHNHIHDCATDSASTGQISGIEFDNDDTASSYIDCSHNNIHDLTCGASFVTSFGYQTDGINTVKATATHIRMIGNRIYNVGEGIDLASCNGIVATNDIDKCYYFGIKLVHGASRNTINDNFLRRCGLSGVDIDGSSSATQDTADNLVFGNYIYDIDPDGTFSANETAGVRFNANGGTTYLPRRNYVNDNFIDCGTNGKHGVLAASGSGTVNYVLRNRVRRAATALYTLNETVVPFASSANVRDFGAVGDGATDDTAAFEAAITANLCVDIPPGTYVVDVDNLRDYTHLRGAGENVTILKRKSGSTYCLRAASAKTGLVFENFSMEGFQTDSPINQEGISLVNPVKPVFINITGKNLYASFSGSPTGRAISLTGGSGARLFNVTVDTCGDGVLSSGHTDGRIVTLTGSACTRAAVLLAASSHRWRHNGVIANGNCTAYAGAGFMVVDSDDVIGFAPITNSNTLGHGYQQNNGDRCKLYGPVANSNGISGVDWYDSKDGELHGVYATLNTVRGVEIDTDSDRTKVFGGKCVSNTDTDWSVYRSADVELHGVIGNVKIHDGTSTNYTVRTSIFGGGQGYTLTVDSGEALNVRVFGWLGTIADSGGHIVWSGGASGLADTFVSDTAYDATSWNGVTGVAPSKNAVRDQFEALPASQANARDTTNTTKLLTPANVIDVGIFRQLFTLTADMNSTSDQNFTKIGTFSNYLITLIRVHSASTSLTTAAGGVYTGAGKTGSIIAAASQVYTGATNTAGTGQGVSLQTTGSGSLSATPILSLTTAQGSTATATYVIYGIVLS